MERLLIDNPQTPTNSIEINMPDGQSFEVHAPGAPDVLSNQPYALNTSEVGAPLEPFANSEELLQAETYNSTDNAEHSNSTINIPTSPESADLEPNIDPITVNSLIVVSGFRRLLRRGKPKAKIAQKELALKLAERSEDRAFKKADKLDEKVKELEDSALSHRAPAEAIMYPSKGAGKRAAEHRPTSLLQKRSAVRASNRKRRNLRQAAERSNLGQIYGEERPRSEVRQRYTENDPEIIERRRREANGEYVDDLPMLGEYKPLVAGNPGNPENFTFNYAGKMDTSVGGQEYIGSKKQAMDIKDSQNMTRAEKRLAKRLAKEYNRKGKRVRRRTAAVDRQIAGTDIPGRVTEGRAGRKDRKADRTFEKALGSIQKQESIRQEIVDLEDSLDELDED